MSIYDNLPAELRATGLFNVWRYSKKPDRNGKYGKEPYNPKTGGKGKSNDPRTFTDYHTAVTMADKFNGLGIGVFGDLAIIDCDHCYENGEITNPIAQHIFDLMDCYTEISPSGTGLRIIAKASDFEFDIDKYYINNKNIGIEIYVAGATKRFLTLTGNSIHSGDLVERGSQLAEILETHMVRKTARLPTPVPPTRSAGISLLTDDEVIQKALGAANSTEFAALWSGDITGYSSHSEADLALCNKLAFYCGRDETQIDRLFRTSSLFRPEKWDRRQSGSTYGAITINKAVTGSAEVYSPTPPMKLMRTAQADFAPTPEPQPATAPTSKRKNSSQPVSALGFELNEFGNANLLIAKFGHLIRHANEREWLHWNGSKWQWDAGSTIVSELAKTTIVTIETKQDKALIMHRHKSQTYRQITAMLNIAKSHPAIAVSITQLDAHPHKLNTPNGIINLKTGELAPPNRDELHTRATSVIYDPSQATPKWLKFLDETFGGDQELIAYVQRLAGYSAVGEVTHHVLPFLYGSGANGKTVFLEVLRRVLGDYAQPAPQGFLMAGRNKHETEIARLSGARLVIASEVNETDKFDEAKVKLFTGGDELTGRFMHQNYFDFTPTHTLWLMGNNLPRVTSGGESFWRRVRKIGFNHTVPEDKRIPGLDRILVEEEGSGILAWIVEGAKQAIAGGLKDPQSVLADTAQYAQEEDVFGQFVSEKLIIDRLRTTVTTTAEVWRAYEQWCKANSEQPIFRQAFGRNLHDKYRIEKANKSAYWGVYVKPEELAEFADSPVRKDIDG